MRGVAFVVVGCLACGPTVDESCVTVEHLAWIDGDVGWICGAAIAPDGTIVVASGGQQPALFEVAPDGASWQRRQLPFIAGPWTQVRCGDVAVMPDGERWVTLAFDAGAGSSKRAIARVPATGEPTVIDEIDGVYGRLPPGKLAADRDVLRVAGSVVVEDRLGVPNEPCGYVGVIDRTSGLVDREHVMEGLSHAWGLVVRGGGRLVTLFAEPSIDYADGFLMSIDLDVPETEWVLHLSNETGNLGPVAQIVGIDDEDILVARHDFDRSELTRDDRRGEASWRSEASWDDQVVAYDVAVADEILTLTAVRNRDDATTTTFVERLDPDGTCVCRREVPLPFVDGTDRHAVLTAADGAFLVVDDAPGDSAEPGVHITALRVR